jgi:hypothetical protein
MNRRVAWTWLTPNRRDAAGRKQECAHTVELGVGFGNILRSVADLLYPAEAAVLATARVSAAQPLSMAGTIFASIEQSVLHAPGEAIDMEAGAAGFGWRILRA